MPIPQLRSQATPECTQEPATRTSALGLWSVRQYWALEFRHLLIVVGFCAFFMHYAYMPLAVTDVWGHIAYGNWILDHGHLPTEEPFVDLAAGVPIVDTAWLGQVLLAIAGRQGNPECYRLLHAVTVLLIYIVLARAFFLQCQHPGIAVLGALAVWFGARHRNAIIRPEMFGSLCFAVLILLLVQIDDRRSRLQSDFDCKSEPARLSWACWIGIPLLFVAWANLHGSYIVGLVLVGSYAAGQCIETLWQTRSVTAVLRDRRFCRWMLLSTLALIATLINPYGLGLLINTLSFSANPNLKSIMEWYPLVITSTEWIPMAGSWVLLTVVLRHSRTRVTAGDVLQVAVFGLATCERVRMISWYAPAVMLALTPHLADVLRQMAAHAAKSRATPGLIAVLFRRKSFSTAMVAGLVVWTTIALSPVRQAVLSRTATSTTSLYSHLTPLAATRFLREHPPQGLVAAPQWWGDWLVWDGPKGLQLLTTTNSVHVVPPNVWNDYLAMARGAPELGQILIRYRATTVVICKELQPRLIKAIKPLVGWTTVYEDEMCIILELKSVTRDVQARVPPDRNVETAAGRNEVLK